MNRAKVLAAVACGLMAACNQIPTPEQGHVYAQKPTDPQPRQDYVLDVPLKMDFAEGQSSDYQFHVAVLDGGDPVVKVEGLPNGATFDPATLKFSWKPGYDAAGNPDDPTETDRSYTVRITVWSTLTPNMTKTKQVDFRVKDVLRPLTITTKARVDGDVLSPIKVKEGHTLTMDVNVASLDFPKGPFNLNAKGLPAGATLDADHDDPTHFILHYTPDYTVATYDVRNKRFNIDLTAEGPRAQTVVQQVQWTVQDVRQHASVSAPDELNVGEVANFMVRADDPNAEEPPAITIDTSVTYPGNPRILSKSPYRGITGSELPSTTAMVVWDGLTPAQMAQPQTLKFNFCVHQLASQTLCENKGVVVHFASVNRPAPAIDRSAWQLGTIKYLKMTDTVTVPMPITDSQGNDVTVEVITQDGSKEATWAQAGLAINPVSEGQKQVQVIATSAYGVKASETFTYTVLPANWSDTVILGDGISNAEVALAHRAFPGSAVYDPVLLGVTDQVLALRKTVVVGTGIFEEGLSADALTRVLAKVPNIVIATPKLDKIPAAILGDGVKLVGRYATLGLPDLSDTELWPMDGAGFTKPTQAAQIQGKLTSESANPMVLSAGTGCAEAFALLSGGQKKATVAVSCKRRDGGSLMVAGFEWADLKISATDDGIQLKWIQEGVKP